MLADAVEPAAVAKAQTLTYRRHFAGDERPNHGTSIMKFLEHPTRNLFFTGKGGVGKTSVACATAVKLADAGKKVLLVSTDPASNLDEVLGVTLGNHPTAIPAISTLFAMNLDPEKSAAEYRERMVGPYRGLLPEAAVKSMEEQFSGSCTLEIAAFDEFSRLLGDPTATAEFDHVIFDTAPTGHTLRLLTLPSAWDGFMEQNTTGTSCLGPLAGLQAQQKLYQESVKALGDPAVTTLVLVARAEASALREAARTSGELAELGVRNQHLVVNGVFNAIDSSDPYAVALQQRGAAALSATPDSLKAFPQTIVPLSPDGILGIDSLRRLGTVESSSFANANEAVAERVDGLPSLSELIDDLVAPGHGVILAMGKGGVGKTTVAAAVAVAIADRGYEVHLSTTDPAAHIAAAMNDERLPNLTVSRIDPEVETAKYSAEVLGKAGANLDAQGKALLEEDLRSPCTEEIAVFRAFADAVAAGTNKFVVLDTAPTGHTVLLLDSALAYHREVTRQSCEMPEAVENLLPRLRDPNFTRVLIVTLPEATPVHEAAALQRDLRRAEIEPYAWVINQVLSPLPITDPLMKQRQSHEQKYLREVKEVQASRVAIIPWQIVPPTGLQALSRLTHSELTTAKS
jgi:arsenite/tail-anchored protein-transporting ATPase